MLGMEATVKRSVALFAHIMEIGLSEAGKRGLLVRSLMSSLADRSKKGALSSSSSSSSLLEERGKSIRR